MHLPDLLLELQNRGNSVDFSKEQLDFDLLSKYDVLILFIPFKYFQEDEREAIVQFVKDGGGLIIFGEDGGYMDNKGIATDINSISIFFGIRFNRDVVEDSRINRKERDCHPIIRKFEQHPVTEGVCSIGYICGCSLNVQSPATALAFGNSTTYADGKKGDEVVVLAAATYGKGKIVAIGDTEFLEGLNTPGYGNEKDDYLSFMDNKELALNMFDWVTPIKSTTAEADSFASEGYSLFSQGEYSQAKSQFEKALEIYSMINIGLKVTEMDEMINKCTRAINAEIAYETGEEYYRKEDLDEALEKFQTCKSLYDEVGDTIGSEKAQSMINKCSKSINAKIAFEIGMEYHNQKKYKDAITKFEEAIELYSELGNTRKIGETQNKLEDTKKERDEHVASTRQLILLALIGAFVIATAFSAVKIFFKRFRGPEISEHLSLDESAPCSETPEISEHLSLDESAPCSETPEISEHLSLDESAPCSFCGKPNDKGAFFCKHCGEPLKDLNEREREKALKMLKEKYDGREITEEEYDELMKELKEMKF